MASTHQQLMDRPTETIQVTKVRINIVIQHLYKVQEVKYGIHNFILGEVEGLFPFYLKEILQRLNHVNIFPVSITLRICNRKINFLNIKKSSYFAVCED